MSASDEEARPVAGTSSPATNAQNRVRLTITTIHAGHRSSGSDDDLSATERRGTPRDATEGLDQDSPRSDHSHPYHTTLGLGSRVSEPKGGIDVLKGSSPPDSVGKRATPAGTPSAGLPASSPPMEVSSDPEGFGLIVAAIKPSAVSELAAWVRASHATRIIWRPNGHTISRPC